MIVSCQQKSKWQIEETEIEKKIKVEIEKLEADNSAQVLIDQFVYLGLDSLQPVRLKDFVCKPRLFLYFSANTCSSCVDQTVETIETIFPGYKTNDNIVFVSPDYPARYRINCYGKKLLFLEKGKLGLTLEKREQPPFLFILDKNMRITTIHVVNKMDFSRTEQYLRKLKSSFDLM
jgi:hypothetical protein